MESSKYEGPRTLAQAAEVTALADHLIDLSIHDETYRAWIITPIDDAVKCWDLDLLRVYRNVTLQSGFNIDTMSFKYAEYAYTATQELGHEEAARVLTPEVLQAFETVAKARQDALDRTWVWGYGNDELLGLLIERPDAEHVLLHLIKDRRITDTKQLLELTSESLAYLLPLNKGAL